MSEHIKISEKKAMLIYASAKYLTSIIALVITAILARILTPKDFSIVAIINVFITLFTILADMGLGTGVIQFKNLTSIDIREIYSVTIYISLLSGLLFSLFGIPLSMFFDNKAYISVCLLLGIAVFFSAANTIPNAILLKDKKFVSAGFRLIIVNMVSGAITIVLAIVGFQYYALVLQIILVCFFNYIWNVSITKLPFSFKCSLKGINKIKNYSMNQFGYSVTLFLSQNLDNLLIGKYIGDIALAYYDKAYKLMRYPIDNIAHAVTPVLHPYLSEHQKDKNYIYLQYTRLVKVVSLIAVYITVVCFWCSREIVLLFYGKQWIESIVSFQFLSLCLWAQLVNAFAGGIYQSIGCTKEMFTSGKINIVISIVFIISGIISQRISIVALLVSVSFMIKFFVEVYFLIYKSFHKKISSFMGNFFIDGVIFTLLFFAMYLFNMWNIKNIFLSLCAKVFFSSIVYVVLLTATNQFKHFKILSKQNKRS